MARVMGSTHAAEARTDYRLGGQERPDRAVPRMVARKRSTLPNTLIFTDLVLLGLFLLRLELTAFGGPPDIFLIRDKDNVGSNGPELHLRMNVSRTGWNGFLWVLCFGTHPRIQGERTRSSGARLKQFSLSYLSRLVPSSGH
jgi:hypothetical protein